MERFPLEMKIPLDVWREIKTYIVHNVQIYSKPLKIYPSATKSFRCVKMIYSPSLVMKNLPSDNKNYSLIIEYVPFFYKY